MTYVVEEFSAPERAVLAKYVTNVDGHVFALVNLPEVVKGALFARYSRTQKSLRRLLLDEFAAGATSDAGLAGLGGEAFGGTGLAKARELYDKIFVEFGDDSVAQLGGAHLAVEQASNLLTKLIERGRLAAYLEQSTRYVAYDDKPGGRWRYYREPSIMASAHADAYRSTLDRIFESYAGAMRRATDHFASRFPRDAKDPERVWKSAIRAKSCDLLRGMLPAATVSNVGIFASGQAYESMLLRLRSSSLAEARSCADAMLVELDKVIPAFVSRVGVPERGGVWVEYLRETRERVAAVAEEVLASEESVQRPLVTLTDFDPDGDAKLVAAMLYESTSLPDDRLLEAARRMGAEERLRVMRAYVGDRANRRHRPGRALERIAYRFDVLGDYGAFRDLQRHRMLTIGWQKLTPAHGAEVPDEVDEAGVGAAYREALDASGALWTRLNPVLPEEASYAVCMAYRVRYAMQMNAREAMHLVELRTSPQGHRSYRRVAQEMHRLIAEVAGHKTVAEMMKYVDFSSVDLERLEAERRAEAKRLRRA